MNNKEVPPGIPDKASALLTHPLQPALTGRREPSGQKPTLAQRLTRAASAAAVLGTMTFGSGAARAESVNAQGVPNQEDGIMLLTGDIPPEAPILDTTEVDLAGLQADPQALRYIAGGEFMNPNGLGDRLFKLGGNPTVLLSSDAQAAVQFELASQGIEPTPDLAANYAVGKWGAQLSAANGATMVAIDGANVFAFQSDGKVTQLTEGQPPTEISYKTTNPWYKPETRWMEGMGLVGTDGYRITHQLKDGQWQELKDYLPLGTAKQRVNKYLADSMGEVTDRNGNKATNLFDLNPNEVQKFISDPSGKTDGFQSFTALRNTKGEPVIILVTGGKYGIRKDLGNIESIQEAAKKIPDLIDMLNIQNVLQAIAGDAAPGGTFQRITAGTTFDETLGVLKFNETPSTSNPKYPMFSALLRIVGEARGINNGRHFEIRNNQYVYTALDKLSDKDTVDKSLWTKPLIEQRKNRFSPQEYQDMIKRLDDWIAFYSA